MPFLLLDTSVASFLHPKKRHSPERGLYEPELVRHSGALSFQSVAELYLWGEQNNWGPAARADLEQFIARFLVIPYDEELARVWSNVMTQTRAVGRRLESGDAWIAATAVRNRIPLVTHDTDLRGLKVRGLNVICHAP